MRIVAGRHRGRKLIAPAGLDTRPTSDRAREALFNILEHGEPPLEGCRFLDLFAGSGAVGLEAASRGADQVLLVERARDAIAAAKANIAHLGEAGRVSLRPGDASRLGQAPAAFDIVFLDPPYRSGLAGPALAGLTRGGWLAPGALVVVEFAAAEPPPDHPGFRVADTRRYGAARLVFLRQSGSEGGDQAGDGGEAAAVVAGGTGALQP